MADNVYLKAMGFNQDKGRAELSWDKWLASKVPAAAGGLFAHWAYELVVDKWFVDTAKKYGPDIVGSIGLTFIAWAIDHSWGWFDSDEALKAFTDGMMGRGAPAVWNTLKAGFNWIAEGFGLQKKAQGLLSANEGSPSLDNSPGAIAEILGLLADSPRTREMIAQDLATVFERRGMQIDDAARSNFANCLGDLANQYKQS